MSLFFVSVIILGLLAALYDFMFYKIPNILVAALFVIAIPHLLLYVPLESAGITLAISAVILIIGFICNKFGWMGAGDAKLLSVASLWVPPQHIPAMILVMALFGGFLAVVFLSIPSSIDTIRTLAIKTTQPLMSRVPMLSEYYSADFIPAHVPEKLKTPLPYGVAIALALVYISFIKIGALS